jgi:hypothetical protein
MSRAAELQGEENLEENLLQMKATFLSESKMRQSPQTEFTNLKVKAESKDLKKKDDDSISSTRHSPKVRLTMTFYGIEEEKLSWEDNMRLDAFF